MTFQEMYNLGASAFEGRLGWQDEAFAIIVFVIVFNFIAKWALVRLQKRFERQQRVWEDSFVKALYLPLSLFTWTVALIAALHLIFPKLLEEHYLLLITVVGVLSVSWFALRWKNHVIALSLSANNKDKIDVLNKLATIIVIVVTILVLLEVTGRSFATVLAFGGIGGLAIAFASQEVIANFFSAAMIYVTRPFSRGDWIHIPERKIEGIVEEIGWYMTRVRTLEKRPIYIPNSIFSKSVVETPSRMSHRQFKETICLRYCDYEKALKVINDLTVMLKSNPAVDQQLSIKVNLLKLSDGMEIQLSAYSLIIDGDQYEQIKQEILLDILKVLDLNQVVMASPTRVLEIPEGIKIINR